MIFMYLCVFEWTFSTETRGCLVRELLCETDLSRLDPVCLSGSSAVQLDQTQEKEVLRLAEHGTELVRVDRPERLFKR